MPFVHLMSIAAPDIANSAQPGQFVTVCCDGLILRRPFSIHQASFPISPLIGEDVALGLVPHSRVGSKTDDSLSGEGREGEIALLFHITGKGTLWLSQRKKGDKLDILGPLGRGFSIESSSGNLLLVAGGIGVAPLLFLAQCASLQNSITLIQGASTAAQLYPSALLPKEIQFIPVTEDGTIGKKGIVTDVFPDLLEWADQVYACGPIDMYKAMANISLQAEALNRVKRQQSNLKLRRCQVSLEVRMGCGIGACYGCTINTKKGLKQVCRDGPVFELDEIIWKEVRI